MVYSCFNIIIKLSYPILSYPCDESQVSVTLCPYQAILGEGGVHPGPVMTRGGALAIRLVPKRKMINFEQHHDT